MQFATLSSSFCPFQPCQLTKWEDFFSFAPSLAGREGSKILAFNLWLSAKRRGSNPIPDSKLVSKKGSKMKRDNTVDYSAHCTCHPIFMFNLLVPEALADIIDEKCTMEEQLLNNCRQESCVVKTFSLEVLFCTSCCWQCTQYGIISLFSLVLAESVQLSSVQRDFFARDPFEFPRPAGRTIPC